MRGTIGVKLQNSTTISNATRRTLLPFSTSSAAGGDGRGGGRGRGGPFSAPPQFNFTEKVPGNPNSNESKSDSKDSPIPQPSIGRGHGRGGTTVPPPSTGFPAFSSFIASIQQQPSVGRGRGFAPLPPQFENDKQQPQQQQQKQQLKPDSEPKKLVFVRREDNVSPPRKPVITRENNVKEIDLSGNNESDGRFSMSVPSGVVSGAGRGKVVVEQVEREAPAINVENRHIRVRRNEGGDDARSENVPRRQFVRNDDDRGDSGSGRGRESRGRGMVARGRGGRGRGGRGRGRGGFRGDDRTDRNKDTSHSHAEGLFLGDNADGEKLAKKVGPEIMNQLAEEFEGIMNRVLPSPMEDEIVEALDYNCAIEFEPEYIMEFENPDIDEKEPIPLRDALEKMKPFLMKYEGIQNNEEWEAVIEETMERAPILKQIVDHYSGPDRVTAKKQQEELERVARTLPASTPSSVKEFTDRAVKSLQSNPGWGFDKKWQFMDKLVFEVSQHHK